MVYIAPSVIPDIFNRGSSVFALSCVGEEKDTGFPLTPAGMTEEGVMSLSLYQRRGERRAPLTLLSPLTPALSH